ncbi:MAG TPA: DUF6655 family protein [Tepidisphaeraceae bacterium]|jgi:hypothetical protein|nr:DUF6655 family protein [Tepidisphaeraceae bacterium]
MLIRWVHIPSLLGLLAVLGGCATIRVTDPTYTATQLFLESEATRLAVQRISVDQLRDRKVYVDTSYLTTVRENSESLSFRQVPQEYLFLVAELRAKLLLGGVRLVDKKQDADVVLEIRTGGIGVDHTEFLLGLSALTIPTEGVANIPIDTPELAIVKSTKQFGFASIAVIAYWQDTGEVVASSGPFVGRTAREDYWILGVRTHTVGNIPPAQKPPPELTK